MSGFFLIELYLSVTQALMHGISLSINEIIIFLVPVLIAITVHEVAHGYVAYLLGDPTAKLAGRLTLNPIKHLDPIGAIALLIVKVGWAKPVPINPLYFKNKKRDILLVSAAGPISNFVLAIIFSLIIRVILTLFGSFHNSLLVSFFSTIIDICSAGIIVNIGLGIFNLIPIPPLDGSNILASLLPNRIAASFMRFGKYGFIVLLLLFLSGVVQKVILPIIYFFVSKLIPV